MYVVGADGCPKGWFSVCLRHAEYWEVNVFLDTSSLWQAHRNADLILLDVPIGLRKGGERKEDREERHCDKEARQVLGKPRSSGVFRVPCRAAVYQDTHEEASAKNHNLAGKKLTKQVWGIVPKIREVDQFLKEVPAARRVVREVHPEICFWALAGGKPMRHPKGKYLGCLERLEILRKSYLHTDAMVTSAINQFPRRDVRLDDILDALAVAVTAGGGTSELRSLPAIPELDDVGLPMEMVYRAKKGLT